MRNQNRNPQKSDQPREASNQPDWVVKTPKGIGRKQRLERIGAAWDREDGGICLRLIGTQIVNEDLYLFPIENAPSTQEDAQ